MAKKQQPLTERQRQIRDLHREKGGDVTAIAQELNIGVTGVYGHLARIKARGWDLPTTPAPDFDEAVPPVENGQVVDIPNEDIDLAIAALDKAIASEADIQQGARDRIEALRARRAEIENELGEQEHVAEFTLARMERLQTSKNVLAATGE